MEASWKRIKVLGVACCLCSLITAGTARAERAADRQTRNAEVLVHLNGRVQPQTNVQFVTLEGALRTASTTRNGAHLIEDAPEKLVLHIDHLGGMIQVGVGLEFVNSQVLVYIQGREVVTKVVELTGKPGQRVEPQAGGPSLDRAAAAVGAATASSPWLGIHASAPLKGQASADAPTVDQALDALSAVTGLVSETPGFAAVAPLAPQIAASATRLMINEDMRQIMGASNCCVAHATPGCDDPDCQAAVCAADPFCCNTQWDAICTSAAVNTLCVDLCSGGGGCSCCVPQATPGCDDATCQAAVCAADPFCCNTQWDGLCSGAAVMICECCGAVPAVCGNGSIETGEQCDDGNTTSGDGCSATCLVELGPCPPGAIDEASSEPNCGLPTDTVNGGCNSAPPVFTNISCGDTVCGSGAFDGATRDTDWYKVVLGSDQTITWSVTATFQSVIGVVNNFGVDSCAGVTSFLVFAVGGAGATTEVSVCLPAGTWYLFVAPDFLGTVPCPSAYSATLSCAPGACATCGNGILEIGEACDDGNLMNGDGCDSDCNLEPPVNDDCADRIDIDNGTTFADTIGAATDGPAPCGGLSNDIWFNYDSTFTGNLIIHTCPVAGGGSDCCVAHATPGCDDPDCQAAVCGADAFCCDTQWDGLCSGAALSLCADLCTGGNQPTNFDTVLAAYDGCTCAAGGGVVSNCCTPHGTPGCDDAACQAAVCGADAFCCDVQWDSLCSGAAQTLCAALCAAPGGMGALLACNDDFCGLQSQIVIPVVAGNCYKLQVGGFFGATGNVSITIEKPICGDGAIQPGEECDDGNTTNGDGCDENCQFEPPPNDQCPMRIDIFNGSTAYSNTGADSDGPSPCGGMGSDIWYNYDSNITGNLVITTCPVGASDCCFAHATPGCDDAACQAAVCGQDAFCCDTQWDGLCSGAAATLCAGLCGGGGGPPLDSVIAVYEGCTCPGTPSDCCVAHATPGCSDPDCQAAVCGQDAFCCDTQWDGLCSGAAQTLCADLCGGLDTPIACNDDTCGFQSQVVVPVVAGTCYKIQLGGFNGAQGSGVITIEKPICGNSTIETGEQCDDGNVIDGDGCSAQCTTEFCAGGEDIDEASSEPNCGLPADTVNGGCNSIPPVFTNIACGQSVCGSGAFDGATRDTDWYKIVLAVPTDVTWSASASFNSVVGIVNNFGVDSCAGVSAFLVSATAGPGAEASVTACLAAGTWYLFVAPDFVAPVSCPAEYTASVSCVEGCIPPPGPCDPSNPNSCLVPNGTPGCGDVDCCMSVCAADPFCCEVQWDGLCSGAAAGLPECTDLPPSEDDCEDRTEIFNGTTPASNVGATTDGPSPCGGLGSDKWYNYNAPCTGTITVDTFGSGFDTVLAAYDGCTCPAGAPSNCCSPHGTPGCDDPDCQAAVCGADSFCCDVQWDGLCSGSAATLCADLCGGGGGGLGPLLACNDDTGGLQSQISFPVVDGNCYKIQFGGFNGVQGSGQITITKSPDCEPVGDPTGACCLIGTDCDEDLTALECAAAGGTYQGDNSECFNEVGGSVQDHVANPNLAIPDNVLAGVSNVINVAGTDVIADVNVDLIINHTWVGDLCVTLSHGGTTINLIQEIGNATAGCGAAGFGCSSNNLNVILDDEGAGGALESLACPGDANAYPTSPPNYTPLQALSAFDGMTKDGAWTLNISDSAAADTGTLVQWSLHFTTPGTQVPKCGCTGDDECDDGNACTDDSCDAGVCVNSPSAVGTPCGSPSDTDCDNPDSCDGAGNCSANNAPNGSGCTSDGNACTNDVCSAGVCTHPNSAAGTPCGSNSDTDCDNPDSCNGSGSCSPNNAPNGTPCSDGNACTAPDTCQGGGCSAGGPVDCDDNNECTDDGCDPASGCTHTDVVCDDGDDCTTDGCDPASGCTSTPIGDCSTDADCPAGSSCVDCNCVSGTVEYPLDIREKKCPNKLKCNSGGTIKAYVVGTASLNVHDIDLDTLQICVCGTNDCVQPDKPPRIKDKVGPHMTACGDCSCQKLKKDYIDDIEIKFKHLCDVLDPNLPEGSLVDWEVRGNRLDGTPIKAHDCTIIDRPGSGQP